MSLTTPGARRRLLTGLVGTGVLLSGAAPPPAKPTVDSEVATARRLAGTDFASSLSLCGDGAANIAKVTDVAAHPTWLPPTRAFDNLWFVGSNFVGVWILKTSQGLILFDTGGSEADFRGMIEPRMRAVGLDPAQIRYAIPTHNHWDHYGGAKYLQERYGTRIGMSRADWDTVYAQPAGSIIRAPYFGADRADRPPPRRDMVIVDGQKLRLGDTEVTLLITPGHTLGTISALIPVREGRQAHVMSLLGGTAFPPKMEPDELMAGKIQFEKSVNRLAALSRAAGADGLINTHISVDGSIDRLEKAGLRKPGEPNPFVLGADKVGRYYGMFAACLRAAMLRPQTPNAPLPGVKDGEHSH